MGSWELFGFAEDGDARGGGGGGRAGVVRGGSVWGTWGARGAQPEGPGRSGDEVFHPGEICPVCRVCVCGGSSWEGGSKRLFSGMGFGWGPGEGGGKSSASHLR